MKDLVKDILSCSTSPDHWDETLDRFNDTFQISASCMFSVHEFREFRLNFAWSEFNRIHLPPEARAMMERGEDGGDRTAYHFLLNSTPQTLYDEPTMFGVNGYEDLPPSNVRDVTESLGFVMRLASTLNKSGPWIDGFFTSILATPNGGVLPQTVARSRSSHYGKQRSAWAYLAGPARTLSGVAVNS